MISLVNKYQKSEEVSTIIYNVIYTVLSYLLGLCNSLPITNGRVVVQFTVRLTLVSLTDVYTQVPPVSYTHVLSVTPG